MSKLPTPINEGDCFCPSCGTKAANSNQFVKEVGIQSSFAITTVLATTILLATVLAWRPLFSTNPFQLAVFLYLTSLILGLCSRRRVLLIGIVLFIGLVWLVLFAFVGLAVLGALP
jgi:hypothetical protein